MNTGLFKNQIFDLLIRLWRLLSLKRQRQFVLLIGLTFAGALSEIISLGTVLPLLGVLIEPSRVYKIGIINRTAQAWGIQSADQLVLPITLIFVSLALLSGAIRLLMLWTGTGLASAIGADISYQVYRRTLYQSYQVHITTNSSDVISRILNTVWHLVFGVLQPFLTLVSSLVLLLALMSALIVINATVALAVGAGFGGAYCIISWLSRRQLIRNGQRILHEQTQVIKALQEGLGGIRDVLLHGTQQLYCDIYRSADGPLRRAQTNNIFIAGSPRFVMEAVGMALIAILAYALSRHDDGISVALPTLGALAMGAQRLLPTLQQSYSAWTSIATYKTALVDVLELLEQPISRETLESNPNRLPFEDAIHFKGVRFRYDEAGQWVLSGIDLTIPKSVRVGIVGSTGSGKSTMLDLLMGLLTPTEGAIHVDGVALRGDFVRAWQQNIAHVPQNIYLADATIAENIAFGIPKNLIDLDRVREAARQAQIADFIESKREGYDAHVGERGISLSGGQRQRIGIARALYRQAGVLIFDEATSALDDETECAVMDAIKELGSGMTIFMIAHRIHTLKYCDVILKLEHGRIVWQGTYQEIMEEMWEHRA